MRNNAATSQLCTHKNLSPSTEYSELVLITAENTTVVLRKNQPMMGNGSTAGPLMLGTEEKNVVIVIGNEDPSEKR